MVADLEILPARPWDAPEIVSVHLRSWQTAYRGIVPDDHLDRLTEELSPRESRSKERLCTSGARFPHVATNGGVGVVGFPDEGPARSPHFGVRGELGTFYLLSEYCRHVFGRALTGTPVEARVRSGFRSMVVWVLSLDPARVFCERLGGVHRGTAECRRASTVLEETAYGGPQLERLREELSGDPMKWSLRRQPVRVDANGGRAQRRFSGRTNAFIGEVPRNVECVASRRWSGLGPSTDLA